MRNAVTAAGRDGGKRQRLLKVGVLFAQFAAYHVDRCEAVACRLHGRAEVLAVEVATTSETYAWAPSGEVTGARKVVLFPGESYERIGVWRRFQAQLKALYQCDAIFVGIGYNEPDVIMLAMALRALGRRVILMSESKFDDRPRNIARELAKSLLLTPFHAALVGGPRHLAYMRFLGFRRRTVLTGYDAVSLDRVRAQGSAVARSLPFSERPFVFVGRFVAKKNLEFLLDCYRLYRNAAGAAARRLVLAGGGELEPLIRERIQADGLAGAVQVTGFLDAPEVARILAGALALVVPSIEEQWGLVVNEALAFDLPIIASEAVGARDTLVQNLVNGFVLDPTSVEGWAAAMGLLSDDEGLWHGMVEGSRALARSGDVACFAAAVEKLMD
jgi:L-malate glycosyltransferase